MDTRKLKITYAACLCGLHYIWVLGTPVTSVLSASTFASMISIFKPETCAQRQSATYLEWKTKSSPRPAGLWAICPHRLPDRIPRHPLSSPHHSGSTGLWARPWISFLYPVSGMFFLQRRIMWLAFSFLSVFLHFFKVSSVCPELGIIYSYFNFFSFYPLPLINTTYKCVCIYIFLYILIYILLCIIVYSIIYILYVYIYVIYLTYCLSLLNNVIFPRAGKCI